MITKPTEAVILAAGEGKRLRPLTRNTTKALIEVNGKPLLQILIEQLKTVGISKIIVIVNHFKEKIIEFYAHPHLRLLSL